ncbi:MAG: tetratricopeptide repeat protein [Candidatus Latescibacterota bacterium]|nr:tetratricopeptide repeat protein [Candidatus Latescibacterota bacterium]
MASFASAFAQSAPKAVDHFRTGYSLLQAKDFRNAAIELDQAVQIDTTYGDAYYALGKAQASLNDYPKSVAALEAALRHGTSKEQHSARIPELLGKLYYKSALRSREQLRYGEAIQRFEKSLEYQPGNAQALFTIGDCHMRLRDPDKAEPAFRAAIEADAKYAWAHKRLGDIHRSRGEMAQAAQKYEHAIALDRDLVKAYAGLAHLRIAGEDFDGAIATLQQAVKANPSYAEGFVLIGTLLNRLSRHGEAAEPLQSAASLEPKNAEAHYRLAEARFGTGDFAGVIEAGNRAVRLRRDFYPAMVILADAHFQLGEANDARSWYEKAKVDSRFKDYCTYKIQELDRPADGAE